MKLTIVGSNMSVLTLHDGTQVLFSYRTPVAASLPNNGYIVTTDKYSKTTSRHINKWLDGIKAAPCSQEYLNEIVTNG